MVVIVEDFEDIPVGSNAPLLFTGAIRVGATAPFTFPSGMTLTAPNPNDGLGPLFVADFDQGWRPTDIRVPPSGTAFLDIFLQLATFTFDTPVHKVSAKMGDYHQMGLAAFDAAGKLIAVSTSRPTTPAEWNSNVAQVLSKAPIKHVVILGHEAVVDDLTIDTGKLKVPKASGKNDVLKGKDKSEFIDGKGGNDKIDGKGGDDTLLGGKGKDKIKGGAGNDALVGGDGGDNLKGGDGEDTFLFGALGSVDKIKDFDPFDDTMILPRTVFAKFAIFNEYLQPHQFVVGPAALDADDFLLYNFNTGALAYDVDGNGPTAPIQFAKLKPGLALTAEDFLVV